MKNVSLNQIPSEISLVLKTLESVVELLVARQMNERATPASNSRVSAPASTAPTRRTETTVERIDWPVIGGRRFVSPSRELFLSEEFRARYRPGDERTVYAARCPGLGELASDSKLQLSKVSSCKGGRLSERIHELNADRYGGTVLDEGRPRIEVGWDDWYAIKLNPRVGPSPGSPVTLVERGLLVRLPATMGPRQFDDEFDEIVQRGAFQPWLSKRDGKRHCALADFEPMKAQRFTTNGHDSEPRISEAKELCVFRRGRDHDRLISIIEYIILRHLQLLR